MTLIRLPKPNGRTTVNVAFQGKPLIAFVTPVGLVVAHAIVAFLCRKARQEHFTQRVAVST